MVRVVRVVRVISLVRVVRLVRFYFIPSPIQVVYFLGL